MVIYQELYHYPSMLSPILKKVRQQLVLMLAVALVLVAAYVSAGRQFMPAISGYVSFFEEQVLELSGIPVTIESLEGDFEGFNPIVHVNGLSLLIADSDPTTISAEKAALYLQRATVVVDIPQSIWQRRWVLEDFVVDALELNFDQLESGAWQMRGLAAGNDVAMDFDSLFQSLQQVSQLRLSNVVMNLRNFDGGTLSFTNGLATISNRDNRHYLHADLTLEDSLRQMQLSFEITGNTLANMAGQLHVELPRADYSELFARQSLAELSVGELHGSGNFWFNFSGGQLSDFVSDLQIDTLALQSSLSDSLALRDLSGLASLRRRPEDNLWELALSDMSLSWRQMEWENFNVFMSLVPEASVELRADTIDVSLIAQFATSSGMMSESAREQLEQYAPRGMLENFSLHAPLDENTTEHVLIKTNLNNVDVASVRGSPNIWGIHGYLEVDYDAANRLATGFAEVESDEFRMNIPNMFTSIWEHNYVNGSLGFSVDLNAGTHIRLKSNVVEAETDIVDGRVQFTSIIDRPDDAEPSAELELLVGALRFDAAGRAAYLPDGPQVDEGLANTMRWLNGAILDGTITNSGALFRGSTLPGSPAATKTFQSFYVMNEGTLNFSDDWPKLNDVSALGITDDNNIDIEVQEANSLNVIASSVNGSIRQNAAGQNWLSIAGRARGLTSDGLNYLQNADVGENLKNAFANWQAEGDFTADINVEVPLNRPELLTEVRLEMNLQDNTLLIPDYALRIAQLTGPVIFDTRTGIEPTALLGRLFDQRANIQLSSLTTDGKLEAIRVAAAGLVSPEQLIAWPMQSQFVRDILASMEGQLAYQASLSIDPNGGDDATNRLVIDSTLLGASLALPHPFTKPVEIELPLKIDMAFAGDRQMIVGSLGSTLSFDLDLRQGEVFDGLIFVGEAQSNFENLRDNGIEGFTVLGNMDRFQLQQWSDFLAEFTSDESVSEGLGNGIEFVDLQIEQFQFYGQELSDVHMRITPQLAEQNWQIGLQSDSVAGQVTLPFSSEDYLSLDLQYLRLPGNESDRIGPQPEATIEYLLTEIEDPVDVLADVDPRDLPRMHFATNEFRIGDRPYGNWSFTLNPNDSGVDIDNLAFDFRGLRLGMDEVSTAQVAEDEPDRESGTPVLSPQFSWHFDGENHRSALTGVLTADNMADVLTANGYAPSLESSSAEFIADLDWPGSPAFFAAANLSGALDINIEDGRFLQRAGAAGALKLISILNFDAIMRRLRFSDDLLRSGLAYDEITGQLTLDDGQVHIEDRLVISGPSSLYQITGDLNLKDETIVGEMYLTLPVSENIPWLGLLTANIPLAVGAYLFDRIFGSQVNSLTSAVYTLEGPWEDLEPEFKQAFGSPNSPTQNRNNAQ
ncbi:MAG: DUF3971 domain-containing protein [Pseudohongiellaceae bacterium]